MQIHVVQPGETLWIIAERYGTTVRSIAFANGLIDVNLLVPGLALVIPVENNMHTVKSGETLSSIAALHHTTVDALRKENDLRDTAIILPGMKLRFTKVRPPIDVNAYTINDGETGARELQEVGRYLTYWMGFAYRIREDGSLVAIDDEEMLKSAYAERIVPVLCITNFSADTPGSALAHTILTNNDIQDKLLTNIVSIMKAKGYEGLNVDFENVLPEDRERYNAFLQKAVDRLHPEGYFVSTAVAPKTSSEQKGLLYEAHDYEAQGKIVDFIVLMTYEWGYRLGPPQAISPVNEMKRVVEYAVSVIPPSKLFLGFQIYARAWRLPHETGQEAETFSPQEAVYRALKYRVPIQYDEKAQSPNYRYVDAESIEREVWFEDARSAQAKFDLVKQYKLQGISYWVLGNPFPQNWLLLEDNFTINKIERP